MLDDYSQGQTILIVGAVVVVGLIGLLVVTVIGAAVVGSFVLGVGSSGGAEAAVPQAEFAVEETADGVRIVHEGGDSIDTARLAVVVDGSATQATGYDGTGGDGTFDPEESLAVTADSGSTVQLVWTPPDSDDGDVLLSYEVA